MSLVKTTALIVAESLPQWQLQDAKNRFSAVVKAAAAGSPQVVTVHGVRAAVVLSPEAYDQLTAIEPPARRLSEVLLCPPVDDAEEGDDLFARERRDNAARELDL